MRNVVVDSLEIVLWAVLAAFVIIGTIVFPVVGTIIGLVIGAAVTGIGFVLISINSHLAEISKLLNTRGSGFQNSASAAVSPSGNAW